MLGKDFAGRGKVAIHKATPAAVLNDYARLLWALQSDGYRDLIAGHNHTVVRDAYVGERNNKHKPIVDAYGLRNVHLYEPYVKLVRCEPNSPLLALDKVFPGGIYIGQSRAEGHLPQRVEAIRASAAACAMSEYGQVSHAD